VRSVPTIVVIRSSQVVYNKAGGPDEQSLIGLVNQAMNS
jgi:hypothetical protein